MSYMGESPEIAPVAAFEADPAQAPKCEDQSVEIHKPKPVHNSREFLGEVAIIVLGVLIALTGEQLVEAWHWHETVDVVRTSLMGELANDRGRWEVNMAIAPCAVKVIDRLDRWAQEAPVGAAVPIKSTRPSDAIMFWMHSANWDLASGSQTLSHFPLKEQLALAALYDGLAHRQLDLEKVSDLSEQLATLVPLATDTAERRQLRVTIGNLKTKLRSITSNDAYMTRHFDALGIKADRSDIEADLTDLGCEH
ncbi:hypothetical protein [Sphingomonas oligophenolica]|uniref:Uncharacterized protein n=1 Tax=Sphingomonas oligophenolica TaxID=301154 RepID=A0A502CRU5_9SPHN|nr:hypothetical protein [Sphingomonas oligophenolica]TPG15452.1 hypothetical protein EAH84_01185 [Sphingomonas oligophenolica]